LTIEDKVELIKMNFLEEYGGVEYERKIFVEQMNKDIDECDIESFLTFNKEKSNVFNMNYNWEYTMECKNTWNTYNDRQYRIYNSDVTGQVISNKYTLNLTNDSNYRISGNYEDQKYSSSGFLMRSFTFEKGLNELQDFSGSISFIGSSCEIDLTSGDYTEVGKYSFIFKINNLKIFNDKIRINGTMALESGKWILTFESGESFSL
ncbi:MAG: hypothetical protein KJN84_13950, partial [Bacteroidia bacterium]|nr:hypothetical protein [Bacteroidia bacterium]